MPVVWLLLFLSLLARKKLHVAGFLKVLSGHMLVTDEPKAHDRSLYHDMKTQIQDVEAENAKLGQNDLRSNRR